MTATQIMLFITQSRHVNGYSLYAILRYEHITCEIIAFTVVFVTL